MVALYCLPTADHASSAGLHLPPFFPADSGAPAPSFVSGADSSFFFSAAAASRNCICLAAVLAATRLSGVAVASPLPSPQPIQGPDPKSSDGQMSPFTFVAEMVERFWASCAPNDQLAELASAVCSKNGSSDTAQFRGHVPFESFGPARLPGRLKLVYHGGKAPVCER